MTFSNRRFSNWELSKRKVAANDKIGQHAHHARVRWAPSRLRRIARHPALWWALALVLMVGGGTSLVQRAEQLEQARANWGAAQQVLVVASAVGSGERVAGSVEVRELPVALIPDGAVSDIGSNAFARVDLFAGEVLLDRRVSANQGGELPDNTAALTVTLAQRATLVDVGDLVDLWTVDTAAGQSHRVAHRVVVLGHDDATLTIAVPHADVGDVALAAVRPLTAALVG